MNYWIWSDLPLEKLNIPEGLSFNADKYGPEEGEVEYIGYDKNGKEVAVLDVKPLKKI